MTNNKAKHTKYKVVFEKLSEAEAGEFGRSSESLQEGIRQITELSELLATSEGDEERQFTST